MSIGHTERKAEDWGPCSLGSDLDSPYLTYPRLSAGGADKPEIPMVLPKLPRAQSLSLAKGQERGRLANRKVLDENHPNPAKHHRKKVVTPFTLISKGP
jgi:hypothetical protein